MAATPGDSGDPASQRGRSFRHPCRWLGRRVQVARPALPHTSPHARGGLGEVYVARDEELNREVALKEIQECHSHDLASRSRLLLEAELTGGLEHPGIVPVYGLGQYADGRPFLTWK